MSLEKKIDELFLKLNSNIKPGLEITANLLENLENPHNKFKSIHIAGTNGKGSVASYLENILRKAGFKTGLYTSPHLYDFRERIKINGEMVSKEDLLNLFHIVESADTGSRNATFFEFTTAMAFKHFEINNVDVAIIETGMGGRFDSTNLVDPLISVITNVSIDHIEFLGDKIEDIAGEKAGIIKEKRPVIFGDNPENLVKIMERASNEKNSRLFVFKRDFSFNQKNTRFSGALNSSEKFEINPGLPGRHQIINALVAGCAIQVLNEFYPQIFSINNSIIEKGINRTMWKGRLQTILEQPEIIVDCAHNEDSAKTLSDFLKTRDKKVKMIFGTLEDKSFDKTLKILEPVCNEFIFTKPDSPRACSPSKLKKLVSKGSMVIENPVHALNHAFKTSSKDELIVVAGSIYVSGVIIEAFEKNMLSFPCPDDYQG